MKDFYDLFINELREIYAAERLIVKSLPEIFQAARSQKLKEVIAQHLKETEAQVARLEQVFAELKESHTKTECRSMVGLLNEWKFLIKSHYEHDVQDAAIICFLQKVKHYEIAVYGTLQTFAKHLKLTSLNTWLRDSAKEEGAADKKLTEIAEGSLFTNGVNKKACCKRHCA